jgi:hypothetical protein
MSGYLRRLVERHAAEPAARPRALSRFETGALRPREISREAAVPPPIGLPPAPFADHIQHPKETAASPGVSRSRRDEGRPALAAPPESNASAPTETPARSFVDPPAFDRPLPSRLPVTPDVSGVPPPGRRPGLGVPIRAVTTVVPRTAPPAATVDRPPRRPARAGSFPVPREPDVVRVQIGRVEVRAVLPPAGRPAPQSSQPPAEGPLSLERYLARKGRP